MHHRLLCFQGKKGHPAQSSAGGETIMSFKYSSTASRKLAPALKPNKLLSVLPILTFLRYIKVEAL